MSKVQKTERKYETKLVEGNPDLTKVWLEVVNRLKRGDNYGKRH